MKEEGENFVPVSTAFSPFLQTIYDDDDVFSGIITRFLTTICR